MILYPDITRMTNVERLEDYPLKFDGLRGRLTPDASGHWARHRSHGLSNMSLESGQARSFLDSSSTKPNAMLPFRAIKKVLMKERRRTACLITSFVRAVRAGHPFLMLISTG